MHRINSDGFPEAPARPSISLCVVSSNPEMAAACRAQLEQLCSVSDFSVEQCCSPSEAPHGCDIYVWDNESCPSLPPAMATPDPSIRVVIAKKGSLSAIRHSLGGLNFTLLLGPISEPSLRVALGSALVRLHLLPQATSSGLNLDWDLLLQHLLEANVKLHEFDKDRSNFLTRAIHDIRVPLMAVQGYCDLLLAGQVGSIHHEQAQILGRMRRSLTRLGRIVEAVMTLGAKSRPSTQPKFENASLEACIEQAVHEIRPMAERKQIRINVYFEPPTDSLLLDPGQIEQVLVNLLDNGCKFTPRGGAITIRGRSCSSEGSARPSQIPFGYRVDICDTGPGIRPEHIEDIFDEHTSYGDAMDRSGSGLGLAICRMIVQAHNGQIWASSDERGATFSLVLPMVQSFNNLQLAHAIV